MRVVVIGGMGHIGRFLVGQLWEDGHEVIVVSSGRSPAPREPGWDKVQCVTGRYAREGAPWKTFLAGLRPEVLVDIIDDADHHLQIDLRGTYEAVRGTLKHYLFCGSVWMFGAPVCVPAPEIPVGEALCPGYVTRFRELQELFVVARQSGPPLTAIMPPNLCGPGRIPLDCKGTESIELHRAHARGEPVFLPEGINTLIEPCDVSDVAQGFRLAVRNRDAAANEMFNVGAPYALTFPQFVRAYAEIHGVAIPIEYVSSERFFGDIVPDPVDAAHFRHHMCPDVTKISRALGYRPQFTCEQAMARAVEWMWHEGILARNARTL